jgi:hypothetical protein
LDTTKLVVVADWAAIGHEGSHSQVREKCVEEMAGAWWLLYAGLLILVGCCIACNVWLLLYLPVAWYSSWR